LSRAEQRLRAEEVARLHQSAGRTRDPEHYRWLLQQAKRVNDSEPVCCHVERQRELSEQIAGASSRIEGDSEGNLVSEHSVYRDLQQEHAEAHTYPRGLQADVDRAFLGRAISADAAAIVTHHRSRHG
jgi:hypothetical protein